jgi:hypothetical protein
MSGFPGNGPIAITQTHGLAVGNVEHAVRVVNRNLEFWLQPIAAICPSAYRASRATAAPVTRNHPRSDTEPSQAMIVDTEFPRCDFVSFLEFSSAIGASGIRGLAAL